MVIVDSVIFATVWFMKSSAWRLVLLVDFLVI